MVLDYAEGRSLNNLVQKNLNWLDILRALSYIISGLEKIHEKHMVHRDFHTGNILIIN